MKKSKLFFFLSFIGFALSLSAQTSTVNPIKKDKKWKLGISNTFFNHSFRYKNNRTFSGDRTEGVNASVGFFLSRKVSKMTTFGIGYGTMNLNYAIEPSKSLHQLDDALDFYNETNRSAKPYVLEEIRHRNKYQNLQVFTKFSLNKNKTSVFQPSFGLRVDNFWLKDVATFQEWEGGNGSSSSLALLGSLYLTALTGDLAWLVDDAGNPVWESPNGRQRNEVAAYYTDQNQKHFMTISPSFSLDFNFKNVSFGFEPHVSISTKKVNKNIRGQSIFGVRAYAGFRF